MDTRGIRYLLLNSRAYWQSQKRPVEPTAKAVEAVEARRGAGWVLTL